jgi:aminomethyltransferase
MERNSILNERHRALGSALDGERWNDMPLPWRYHTDPHEEVIATRCRAALYDVSALNIVHVTGPDAAAVLDALVSIDVHRLKPGSARLGAVVNAEGALVDDIMIIRDAADRFRISHGSGKTKEQLAQVAAGRQVEVQADRDVHILSLQGPKSLAILAPHVAGALDQLPYFQHFETTLFGAPVTIGRGGYSGERGYEVYCASADAVMLWDRILAAGQPFGTLPASWSALDLTRVEGALLFFPFEMPEGDTTPWEVNMDWAVDLDKAGDYIGKAAVLKLRGRERVKQAGVVCEADFAVDVGAKLMIGNREVGCVTSSSYSRYLMQSLALVHVLPAHTALGTQLTIRGSQGDCRGTVVRTPFYDPLRRRTHGSL